MTALTVTYDFSGSTVLVVGAASGIGRAIALACREAGANVWAADVDTQALASLPKGPHLHHVPLDISSSPACRALIDDIMASAGQIDAAILTAAMQIRTPIDETPDELWQRHLDVNLSGVFYLVRALIPLMRQRQRGSIIAFTSGLASNGWPGAAAYAATKAAIVGLVKSAALELRPYGVRINAVSPGLIATPVFLNSASPDEIAGYEKMLGISAPEDVIPMLMHLISDGSASISGTVVERRLIPAPPKNRS
jgi:NAD(P)-dependent dehydrogenase (short-subunit alcohol dehydrogenase family)